jgi:quinol-cytochrome oxidoreductase complex cytochrome b subunit
MGAIVNLNHPARIVHWHFFRMSVTNLVVIGVLLVVFALAIGLPRRSRSQGESAFFGSWIYFFGVLTVAALGVIVASGAILSLKGPEWWHYTGVGHFFNSVHLWAVELFFFFMVIHLWGKYWTAAWRGGRARVWATGAIGFLVSIPAALTGYVSQQNFDAQWISIQAKDGLNSIGVGAFFNVTNFGQMYGYHVLLLPLAVVALVLAHVLLVRRHGLAPPLELHARLDSSRTTANTTPADSATGGIKA